MNFFRDSFVLSDVRETECCDGIYTGSPDYGPSRVSKRVQWLPRVFRAAFEVDVKHLLVIASVLRNVNNLMKRNMQGSSMSYRHS